MDDRESFSSSSDDERVDELIVKSSAATVTSFAPSTSDNGKIHPLPVVHNTLTLRSHIVDMQQQQQQQATPISKTPPPSPLCYGASGLHPTSNPSLIASRLTEGDMEDEDEVSQEELAAMVAEAAHITETVIANTVSSLKAASGKYPLRYYVTSFILQPTRAPFYRASFSRYD